MTSTKMCTFFARDIFRLVDTFSIVRIQFVIATIFGITLPNSKGVHLCNTIVQKTFRSPKIEESSLEREIDGNLVGAKIP